MLLGFPVLLNVALVLQFLKSVLASTRAARIYLLRDGATACSDLVVHYFLNFNAALVSKQHHNTPSTIHANMMPTDSQSTSVEKGCYRI